MASPVPSYLNSPSSRTPRLSYRKKSTCVDSTDTSATETNTISIPTAPSSPISSDHCSSPRGPNIGSRSPLSPRSSSTASSFYPSTPDKVSKKRTGLFTGLFSVREPSAKALADYQRQMMKQGSRKDGKVRTVGIPGVSSATLPSSVPKVNSKWDGVPQSVKDKEKRKQIASRTSISGLSRHLKSSNSSQVDISRLSLDPRSGHGRSQSYGTFQTAHSNGSRKTLAELYGWEVPKSSSGGSLNDLTSVSSRPNTSRATTSGSAPNPTTYPLFPTDDHRPPMVPTVFLGQSSPSLSESSVPPQHSYSPCLTPYESTPTTPDTQTPLSELNPLCSDPRPCDGMTITTIEAPTSVDEVMVKSAGLNILGPPVNAKRRPKPLLLQAEEDMSMSSAHNGLNPILKKQVVMNKFTPPSHASPTSQLAPCNSDKSYLQRRDSTRERVGSAAHLTSSPSSLGPYGLSERVPEVVTEGDRIITPTPESGHPLKKKSLMNIFHK